MELSPMIEFENYLDAVDLFTRYIEMEHAGDTTVRTDPAFLAIADYVFKNMPPELHDKMREGMHKCFPELAGKQVIDDQGTVCFSVADIAEALGATEDEVLRQCAEMGLEKELRVMDPGDVRRMN